MADRIWRRLVAALAAGSVLAVAACGIDATPVPEVVGGGIGRGQPSDTLNLPEPEDYSGDGADLVAKGFLRASAGAGPAALTQVKKFLTPDGKARQLVPKATQELTVIRIVGKPSDGAEVGRRKPFSVSYQVVGKLTELGRLFKLEKPTAQPRLMTFWLKRADTSAQLLIDEIDGAPAEMLLSDDALTAYYTIQPIYFWDTTYTAVVPDPRYILRGRSQDVRANQLLSWLIEGPSAMLANGVQRLPSRTAISPNSGVVTRDDIMQITLSAEAITGEDEAKAWDRLLIQLQWSLRSGGGMPNINLTVGNDTHPISSSDTRALRYNAVTDLPDRVITYAIVEGKVELADKNAVKPAILLHKENKNVVSAAVNRKGTMAAFVVDRNNERSLVFARDDNRAVPPSTLLRGNVIGRPVWIPGKDIVLVPVDGRLYAVLATGRGDKENITPRGSDNVTSVSISPDGRRIAIVADARVEVAQLGIDNNTITVDSDPQVLVLDQAFVATGVAWTGQEWLYIVGKADNTPKYYQVTADGAVAKANNLPTGIAPTDVVAFPKGGESPGDLYVLSSAGAYRLSGTEAGIAAPFFVS